MSATTIDARPVGAVTPSTVAATALTVNAGTAALPSVTTAGDTNTGIQFPAADTVATVTGGVERHRTDASGNIGVATTPSAWGTNYRAIEGTTSAAFVLASANTNPVQLFGNAFATNAQLSYKTTGVAAVYSCGLTGNHQWATYSSGTAGNILAGTKLMTMDNAGGNLGIGVVPSPWGSSYRALEIGGLGNGIASNGVNRIQLHNGFYIDASGNSIATTVSATGYYTVASGIHIWGTGVATTSGAIITQSNRLTLDNSGQFGVGLTPTARNNSRLQIVDGIGFPATQIASSDANTMDDYEEGTFTPTFNYTTIGDLAVTYTTRSGRYLKVGNRVYIEVRVQLATHTYTTASGPMRIAGLPFVPAASTSAVLSALALVWTKAGITQIMALIGAADTNIYPSGVGSGVNSSVDPSYYASGVLPDIRISGFYETT